MKIKAVWLKTKDGGAERYGFFCDECRSKIPDRLEEVDFGESPEAPACQSCFRTRAQLQAAEWVGGEEARLGIDTKDLDDMLSPGPSREEVENVKRAFGEFAADKVEAKLAKTTADLDHEEMESRRNPGGGLIAWLVRLAIFWTLVGLAIWFYIKHL